MGAPHWYMYILLHVLICTIYQCYSRRLELGQLFFIYTGAPTMRYFDYLQRVVENRNRPVEKNRHGSPNRRFTTIEVFSTKGICL